MYIYMRVLGTLEEELQTVVRLPCSCWELNPGPQGEKSVLLTAEPSLQPFLKIFKYYFFFFFASNLSNIEIFFSLENNLYKVF